jgi:hypothetical protein
MAGHVERRIRMLLMAAPEMAVVVILGAVVAIVWQERDLLLWVAFSGLRWDR